MLHWCGGSGGRDKGVGPDEWQVGDRKEMLNMSDGWLVGANAGC